MTQVQCSFYDSNDVALNGYVTVKLDYTLNDSAETKTWLPVAATVALVSGECTLNLEPSELAGVTYLIEVYLTQIVSVENPDIPDEFIDATVNTKVDEYRVIVPESLTPIQLESLARKTGIDRDRTATMIPVLMRRMYADPNFWSQAQSNLFPHKGDWVTGVTYRRGDVVYHDGSTWLYVSEESSSGVVPVVGATWRLFAARGQNGTGTNGNDTSFSVAWDGQTDAPSRNSVYDALQSYAKQATVNGLAPLASPIFTGTPTRTTEPISTDRSTQLANTNWIQSLLDVLRKAIVPVGTITNYAGLSAPVGWILCDGRVLSQTTYSALYAIIGNIYNTGGELAGEFRVPDLRGRVTLTPDAMGGSAANRSPGVAATQSGGTSTVTLTTAQIPLHKHNVSLRGFTATGLTEAAGSGYGAISFGSLAPSTGLTNIAGNRSAAGDALGSNWDTGSTQAHPNLPPYLACNAIIYTGL